MFILGRNKNNFLSSLSSMTFNVMQILQTKVFFLWNKYIVVHEKDVKKVQYIPS